MESRTDTADRASHRLAKLTLASVLFTFGATSYAGDLDCADTKGAAKAECAVVTGVIVTAGAAVVATEDALNRLVPGTAVLIQMPGQPAFKATLTHKGIAGRVVKTGDVLGLECSVNAKPLLGSYGYATCTLSFPKLKPRPQMQDYYLSQGLQPTWTFGADAKGRLEPGILKTERPIPLAAPAEKPATK